MVACCSRSTVLSSVVDPAGDIVQARSNRTDERIMQRNGRRDTSQYQTCHLPRGVVVRLVAKIWGTNCSEDDTYRMRVSGEAVVHMKRVTAVAFHCSPRPVTNHLTGHIAE